MRVAIAGATGGTGIEEQGAAISQKLVTEENFKEIMEEQMREQDETLTRIEKENELAGLSEIDKHVQKQFKSPNLVSIHRRILADGSYLITEMRGSSLISHYRKRLECNKPQQRIAKDGEFE